MPPRNKSGPCPNRFGTFAARLWNVVLNAAFPRHATFPPRTNFADRVSWPANGGPQVHQCLGVIANALRRRHFFRDHADLFFRRRRSASNQTHSCNDPLDVPVHDGRASVERDRTDCRRRVRTDAWEQQEFRLIRRKLAASFPSYDSSAFDQVPCAGVVTQTCPFRHNLSFVGTSEFGNRRPQFHKSQEIRLDRSHCRLLKHDF